MVREFHTKNLIFMLVFLTAFSAGCTNRKVLPTIPRYLQGVWTGIYSDTEILLTISELAIKLDRENLPSLQCKAERIVSYNSGWLFMDLETAIDCDKKSTDREQKDIADMRDITPEDYRKTFYFSEPNERGEITVSHTMFMSQGWSGSEGIYVWKLDDFSKR